MAAEQVVCHGTQAAGGAQEFTSQWYFDETLNDRR
jgi:hypothetical protein